MVHLWLSDEQTRWKAFHLGDDQYALSPEGPLAVSIDDPDALEPLGWLRKVMRDGNASWVLLAARSNDLRLNGDALTMGIAALRDLDCIQVGAWGDDRGRVYFSTEQLACVEPLAGSSPVTCPRCKQPIVVGQSAVRCPRCSVWHHQLPDKECWTYAPRCAACQSQSTPLDTGYRWTPEDL